MTDTRLLHADLAVGVSAMPLGSLGRATGEVGHDHRYSDCLKTQSLLTDTVTAYRYSHCCSRRENNQHEAVDDDTFCRSGTAVQGEHMAMGEHTGLALVGSFMNDTK